MTGNSVTTKHENSAYVKVQVYSPIVYNSLIINRDENKQ